MNKERTVQFPSERESSKEIYDVNFGCLTISGRSGTGKTRLSDDLAEALGITNVFKTGVRFREMFEHNENSEFQDRDLSIDKTLDKEQLETIGKASTANPTILEGRLAGILTNKVRGDAIAEDRPLPNVVTLLLTANSRTRFQRILKREKKKDITLTIDKITSRTQNREKKDRRQWAKLYPELYKIDPFSPNNKDELGNPYYDIVIDTNGKKPDQVYQEVIERLLETDKIVRRDNEMKEPIIIFP